jgi:hypothetical protein
MILFKIDAIGAIWELQSLAQDKLPHPSYRVLTSWINSWECAALMEIFADGNESPNFLSIKGRKLNKTVLIEPSLNSPEMGSVLISPFRSSDITVQSLLDALLVARQLLWVLSQFFRNLATKSSI